MKRLKKKIIPVLLSALIAGSSVFSNYLQVQAAATATYGMMEVIEAIFASFGVSYMTYDMFDHFTDGNNALKPDWQNVYDSMEDSYEKQWTVINGGGGKDPTPTPDPDFETPPHFSEIVKTAMVSGVLELGKESYGMIKTWMDTNMTASYEIGQLLCDKTMPDGMNVDPAYITGGDVLGIFHFPKRNGQVYDLEQKYIGYRNFTDAVVHASKPACFAYPGITRTVYSAGPFGRIDLFYYGEYVGSMHYRSGTGILSFSDFAIDYDGNGYSNIISSPVFASTDEAKNYVNGEYSDDDEKVKAPIWVSPDIQETYKNAGKLEFPENAPHAFNVPNLDQLAQLAQQLQNAASLDAGSQTDAATSAMQKYLASLQTNPSPEPGTKPDPGTDPEPTPTPSPDKPSTDDTDKESFLADLKEMFPFCIPFDLIHALRILSAKPETPYFEVPLSIHTFGIDIDYTFVFDFEQFNAIAKALRTVETLGFIVLLIWVTRDLIKG